jgi:hypothetical protein
MAMCMIMGIAILLLLLREGVKWIRSRLMSGSLSYATKQLF